MSAIKTFYFLGEKGNSKKFTSYPGAGGVLILFVIETPSVMNQKKSIKLDVFFNGESEFAHGEK